MGKIGLERDHSVRPRLPHDPLQRQPWQLIDALSVASGAADRRECWPSWPEDAGSKVFCYANGELRKDQQNDEVLRFIDFWKQRTGRLPEELIFDSKLTTYANLSKLNQMGIPFISSGDGPRSSSTRSPKRARSAWRPDRTEEPLACRSDAAASDRQIRLRDYDGPLRRLTIADLGHEEPTLLLTNQLTRSASQLIGRCASACSSRTTSRTGSTFSTWTRLSSAVVMKVSCDLQLTLMASSLYRLLAVRIGNGYEAAKSRHLFRDFIDATRRGSRSPRTRSWSAFRNVPITRC